jgi:tetratricopeptide (TPR) repeat protein
VYTDYAFRYSHSDWPALVDSRFREVNRIYQRNGTGVQWKVLDASQIDPISVAPGIDSRRANMSLHFDRPTDVYVIVTGVREGDRTGSVSPFTRVAVVEDFPEKSESLNARLLAHELAHLFGAPYDLAWFETLMGEKPESNKFSDRTIAMIRRMRNYPFALGIDGLSQDSWEKKALAAVAQDDVAAHSNALAHAHTVLGTALLNERKTVPALAHFRAAVDADPQNKTAHLNLAEAYARNGQDELALQQGREAVRLAPNEPLAHRALGALLGRNHQPEAAVQELRMAVRLEPKNAENQILLALQLAGMLGHLDDSIAALQEALRIDPQSTVARQSLEKARTLKERVNAVVVRERALSQSKPNDPDVHYRLAKAEERAGDLKGAIRDFQKSADLRPGSGTPHTELAELYIVTGDYNTAWAEIRKARALGTEPPQSLLARLPAQK